MREKLMGTQICLFDTPADNNASETRLKELPETFTGRGEVKGFEFRQITRSDSAYIFEVLQVNCPIRYEIFSRKEDPRFGKIAYPTANSFGLWAWAAWTLQEANMRFYRLNEKIIKY